MKSSMMFRTLSACISLMFASTNAVSAMCSGTVVPTPLLGTARNSFFGAAIISQSDMWAVGSVSAGGYGNGTAIIAEHWNGSRWTLVPTPRPMPRSYVFNSFNAVAAVSMNDVWAVGTTGPSYGPTSLVEHWDGKSWTVISSPMLGYKSVLSSATATSSTNVWAAGAYTEEGGAGHALVEMWNGSAWTAVSDPATQPILSISATSATDVWAADGDGVDHWDGVSWTVVSNLSATSISAVAPNDVWIIDGPSTIEHWNGSSWSIIPSPRVDHLQSISAVASNSAWAVGQSSNSPVTEHWDGSAWNVVSSPMDASANLSAVAVSGEKAIAVGSKSGGLLNESEGLEETWNGSRWRLGPDLINESMADTFLATFATASDDGWAAGLVSLPVYPSGIIPLLEHWDGANWHRTASPRRTTELEDIGGRSSSDVWVVGGGGDDCGNGQAAASHWDGVQWADISPNVCGGAGSNLKSVAVVKPNDVWAVGEDDEPGAGGGEVISELAINWTGGRHWTKSYLPDDPYAGGLASVRAVSSNDVWAVGTTISQRLKSYDLIYHFDGANWSDVRVKNPEVVGFLVGLGVVSAKDVWAVGGQALSEDAPGQPLILHWDGLSWSVIPHASAPIGSSLSYVVAISSNDVWAVGSGPPYGSHVEHWNGSVWTTVPTAFAGTLTGLGLIPRTHSVWAVGNTESQFLNPHTSASVFHC